MLQFLGRKLLFALHKLPHFMPIDCSLFRIIVYRYNLSCQVASLAGISFFFFHQDPIASSGPLHLGFYCRWTSSIIILKCRIRIYTSLSTLSPFRA